MEILVKNVQLVDQAQPVNVILELSKIKQETVNNAQLNVLLAVIQLKTV